MLVVATALSVTAADSEKRLDIVITSVVVAQDDGEKAIEMVPEELEHVETDRDIELLDDELILGRLVAVANGLTLADMQLLVDSDCLRDALSRIVCDVRTVELVFGVDEKLPLVDIETETVNDRRALVVGVRLVQAEVEPLAVSDASEVGLALMLDEALPRALRDGEVVCRGVFEETKVALVEPVTEIDAWPEFVKSDERVVEEETRGVCEAHAVAVVRMLALSNEVRDAEAVTDELIVVECDPNTVTDDDLDRDGDPDVEKEPAADRVIRAEIDEETQALCEGDSDGLFDSAALLLALKLADVECVGERVGPIEAERRLVVDVLAQPVANALTEADTVREFVAVKVTDVDCDGEIVALRLSVTVAVELMELDCDAEDVTDRDDRTEALTLTHVLTTGVLVPLMDPVMEWHALSEPENDAECEEECNDDGVRETPDADSRAVWEGEVDDDGGFGSERDGEGLPVAHRDVDGDADTETLGVEGGEFDVVGVVRALVDASAE